MYTYIYIHVSTYMHTYIAIPIYMNLSRNTLYTQVRLHFCPLATDYTFSKRLKGENVLFLN